MSLQSLSFGDSGGEEKVFVHVDSEWDVSSDVEWISFSQTSGRGDHTIIVTVDESNTTDTRNGVITFTYGTSKVVVNVSQGAAPVKLSVEPTSVFISSNGTGSTINVKSNTSWTIESADSWVTCSPSSGNGDAVVTVSGTSYYDGSRFSTLVLTDASGEVSHEISVAQAKNRDELSILKNWLEKPLGVVNVDHKTASYNEVKAAVKEVFTISSGYTTSNSFRVYTQDNASCSNMQYQGLPLESYTFCYYPTLNVIYYSFAIGKSQALYDRKTYLKNFIDGVKFCLGITLTVQVSKEGRDEYSGRDSDGNLHEFSIIDDYVWNGSDYEYGYHAEFRVAYNK